MGHLCHFICKPHGGGWMYDFLEHFWSCKKYIISYHSEVVSEFMFLRCIFIPENILFMKATIVNVKRIF